MNDPLSWPELRRALLEETEPAPGFEQRILDSVALPAARRPSRTVVVAAVALAILVVATLLLAGRAFQRATVPAASLPAASGKPPAISTHALSPVTLDPSGAGWVVEHARQPPLVGRETVLHTADGGAHWTSQLDIEAGFVELQPGPAGQALIYAMGVSTGTGTAAKPPQSSFYSTTDAGAHWQQYPPPAAGLIGAVQIKDGHEAWLTLELASSLVGPPDQWAVYHTVDGARTWQRLATVDLATTFGARNMGFERSANGQYAVFIPLIGGAAPTRLYTTSDGGAHWQGAPIPSLPGRPSGPGLPAISVLPDGHLTMVGQGYLLASDDGGQHWSAPRPLPPPTVSGGVTALDSTHWWLLTRDNQIYSSVDEGATWTAVGRPPKGMTLDRIGFSSPTAGWATASYLRPGVADVLLTTADGGRTWRSLPTPHPYRPAVACGGAGATVTAHAHLSVSYNGKAQATAVPDGIGVTDGCTYRLTTAGTSGTIAIATTPGERGHVYTLGDLLDIWGVADIASISGSFGTDIRVAVLVDGRPYAGDPRTIPLRDGTQVAVQVTGPSAAG
ncbi:MAG TPA: hypothetical protein VKF59_02260 [Candidatus Dormibacteraeota bacterium]|nr:hypothetical protein [Candidatus Dormibacteraeota bacterium]